MNIDNKKKEAFCLLLFILIWHKRELHPTLFPIFVGKIQFKRDVLSCQSLIDFRFQFSICFAPQEPFQGVDFLLHRVLIPPTQEIDHSRLESIGRRLASRLKQDNDPTPVGIGFAVLG